MPAEAGDICSYANGVEYVVTDGGPNFWTRCFLCEATACSTPEVPVRNVRCGQCLAEQHGLLPGQAMYLAKEQYVRDHPLPRYVKPSARTGR